MSKVREALTLMDSSVDLGHLKNTPYQSMFSKQQHIPQSNANCHIVIDVGGILLLESTVWTFWFYFSSLLSDTRSAEGVSDDV